jgi:hypothetical protein
MVRRRTEYRALRHQRAAGRRWRVTRALSTSSPLGAKVRFAASTWPGWISVFPSKPSVVDAVQHGHPGRPSPHNGQRECRPNRRATAHRQGPKLLDEVVCPEDEHRQPRRRRPDLCAVKDRPRRLDHGPQRRAIGSAFGLHRRHQRSNLLCGPDLGDDDGVRTGSADRGEVLLVPRRTQPVHANGELTHTVCVGTAAAQASSRAVAFPSGATASSRSRISASPAAPWPSPEHARWTRAGTARTVADGWSSRTGL